MKSHFKTWRLAAVLAAAVLLCQSAAFGSSHSKWPRGGDSPDPGGSTNCVSGGDRDQQYAEVRANDRAANPNPQVYPPCSKPYGLTYGEWSAKWWQWVYSIPVETNPQLQGLQGAPPLNPHNPPAAVDCSVGQSGPVWFLGADFGGAAARACKVPSDVSIFFPLTNTFFGVIGFDCIQKGSFASVGYPSTLLPVNHCFDNPWLHPDLGIAPEDQPKVHNYQDLVNLVATALNPPQAITADVDGVTIFDLTAYRGQAPVFDVTTPSQNVLGFGWGFPGDWSHGTGVADTYGPNGSDGYWLMLKPLSPGSHTVHFTAGDPAWLEVKYSLTVTPGKKD